MTSIGGSALVLGAIVCACRRRPWRRPRWGRWRSGAGRRLVGCAGDGWMVLFWQSIMNSQNPAEFEAYLVQFPNGVFRSLAEAPLAALRSAGGNAPAAARSGVGDAGSLPRPEPTCCAPRLGAQLASDAPHPPGSTNTQ